MTRPSKLADPAFAERVAALFVEGGEMQDIAAELECSRSTIGEWVRDPRVLVHVKKMSAERSAGITRQIDAELWARILDPVQIKKMDVELLLKVRKELVGRGGDTQEANEDDLEAGIWTLFSDNPALAKAFQEAVGKDAD